MLIPERIATLLLLSTAAEIVNTVGFFANMKQRVNMFIPKTIDETIANAKRMIYTEDFLSAPDSLEYTVKPFPTNGDRFAAHEIKKRQTPGQFTRKGFMSQAIAAGWHKKSKAQLSKMADAIGRDRILVVHGTADRMIPIPHAYTLAERLSKDGAEVTPVIWERQGHVIPIEKREEFNKLLADKVEEFYKK